MLSTTLIHFVALTVPLSGPLKSDVRRPKSHSLQYLQRRNRKVGLLLLDDCSCSQGLLRKNPKAKLRVAMRQPMILVTFIPRQNNCFESSCQAVRLQTKETAFMLCTVSFCLRKSVSYNRCFNNESEK